MNCNAQHMLRLCQGGKINYFPNYLNCV